MSKFFSKINDLLAMGLGVGYIPWAPGTFGSALALAFAILFPEWVFFTLSGALVLGLGALLTAPICGMAEKRLGHDAGGIVLDEMIGMWMALFLLPRVWWVWLAAFLLFRLLDITKPMGIAALQRVPGGWGVLLDDVAAGVVAGLLTHGLLAVIGFVRLAG